MPYALVHYKKCKIMGGAQLGDNSLQAGDGVRTTFLICVPISKIVDSFSKIGH